MKGAFPPPGARSERCAEPRGTGGARPEGGRPVSLERGRSPRGAVPPRAKAWGGAGGEGAVGWAVHRLVLRDFAQDVMDAHLARVDPDETA